MAGTFSRLATLLILVVAIGMGIRFACNACGHVMKVKDEFAGKRGICASCQGKVDIPLESTVEKKRKNKRETATIAEVQGAKPQAEGMTVNGGTTVLTKPIVDPVTEAPAMQWHVLPPGAATPYGPAAGDIFFEWITQGRVTADALVWRQDWPGWQRAGDVLPQLATASSAQATIAPVPPPPVAAVPAGVITPTAIPSAVPVAMPVAAAVPSFEMPTELSPRTSADAAAWVLKQQRDKHKYTTRLAICVLSLIILGLIPLVYIVLTR